MLASARISIDVEDPRQPAARRLEVRIDGHFEDSISTQQAPKRKYAAGALNTFEIKFLDFQRVRNAQENGGVNL